MQVVNSLLRNTRICCTSLAAANGRRGLSTGASRLQQLTRIDVNAETKIATLTLSRLPMNALSLEMMQQIKRDIEQLEASDCRGVVLTSASERIFCPGLDMGEVFKADRAHLTAFYRMLQDMWRTLYSTALPVAALINGHALAGGCMLATCCDYRVILPNSIIGMNETKAGVALPKYIADAYMNILTSRRRAEADLIGGLVYKSEEALTVGLVDAVAPTRDAAMAKCLEFFAGFKGVNNLARGLTKKQLRSSCIEYFDLHRDRDMEGALQTLLSPEFKAFLGHYLQSISKGKDKKP